MAERAAVLLRLMHGGRAGKAGQEPAGPKGRKSWDFRKLVALFLSSGCYLPF